MYWKCWLYMQLCDAGVSWTSLIILSLWCRGLRNQSDNSQLVVSLTSPTIFSVRCSCLRNQFHHSDKSKLVVSVTRLIILSMWCSGLRNQSDNSKLPEQFQQPVSGQIYKIYPPPQVIIRVCNALILYVDGRASAVYPAESTRIMTGISYYYDTVKGQMGVRVKIVCLLVELAVKTRTCI